MRAFKVKVERIIGGNYMTDNILYYSTGEKADKFIQLFMIEYKVYNISNDPLYKGNDRVSRIQFHSGDIRYRITTTQITIN